jgi:hypothetical protein
MLKGNRRRLWHETGDAGCKTDVIWVTKTVRRRTRRREFEGWETKIENYEVTFQAIWPIATFLKKPYGPKASSGIRSPIRIIYTVSWDNLVI